MITMLRRERPFTVLLSGNVLSQIGDGVHEFIFIVAVLEAANNDVALAGLVYFFRFIPYLVLGPLGGALSDRVSRRALMLGADLARMSITACFCVLLANDRAGLASLAAIGMSMTSFRTLFQPAFQGTIRSLVRTEHLPAANGATQLAAEIGSLVGPALGGLALSAIGNAGFVLVLDAATYLLSAACILLAAPKPAAADPQTPSGALTVRGLYGDFLRNLREVMIARDLLVTIACSALCIFFAGAALRILIPSMLKGASYSESAIGYAMSAIAFGAIVGAALCSKIVSDFSTRTLMLCWFAYGLALALLPAGLSSASAIFCGCFILGSFGAFVDVILPTNIQKLSTGGNLGKNFSLFSTLANTGEALSGGFAGALTSHASTSFSITIIGIMVASIAYAGKLKAKSMAIHV
ncbi:putative MFS family arabinose efflux permease [Trinickia symbiotica]|uniref:MFS transporter n=1 Tax=Trinickia symbiotica TaxID=863227 RepID=A0A2N7X2D1_9BURK|nr:MFS transporter [Trinickia symbiotica]PMS35797.1 MFS transporter [Trinickia symbiotica]PPK44572.1 putative MFS family arabinose efflux permease [Trinickia symbiotica]